MHQMVYIRKTPEKFKQCNNHWSFWIILLLGKTLAGHMIMFMTLVLKSSAFKMFSIHTKMQSWYFHIPRVWREFLKSLFFVMDWWISVTSRSHCINKTAFCSVERTWKREWAFNLQEQTWHPWYWGLHSITATDSMSILDQVFRGNHSLLKENKCVRKPVKNRGQWRWEGWFRNFWNIQIWCRHRAQS